jgi:23S rRNA (uracil1939-C5)-methyltransferase
MEIHCPHFKICSGCALELGVERSKSFENANNFFLNHQLSNLSLETGHAEGWRCRARLAIRGTSTKPLIGLFEEGTHQVVDIPFCKIHHPLINQAIQTLRHWIIEEKLSPYDELKGAGLLRYVQLTIERHSQRVQLVLVLNCASIEEVDPLIFERLKTSFPSLWHSLWVNFNKRRDNLIFSSQWLFIFGDLWLWESIRGQKIYFHPESFMQANPEMFERLLMKMETFIPQNAALIEFYAGVGAIGLSLIPHCKEIVCVEIVPIAKDCFEKSRAFLSEEQRQRISFYTAAAKAQIVLLDKAWDVVVVDPPRKGLERPFIQALCAAKNLKRLIYVSCGWESFKRDCEILLKSSWKLVNAELFLFFPGSEHLEILAVFESDYRGVSSTKNEEILR